MGDSFGWQTDNVDGASHNPCISTIHVHMRQSYAFAPHLSKLSSVFDTPPPYFWVEKH